MNYKAQEKTTKDINANMRIARPGGTAMRFFCGLKIVDPKSRTCFYRGRNMYK